MQALAPPSMPTRTHSLTPHFTPTASQSEGGTRLLFKATFEQRYATITHTFLDSLSVSGCRAPRSEWETFRQAQLHAKAMNDLWRRDLLGLINYPTWESPIGHVFVLVGCVRVLVTYLASSVVFALSPSPGNEHFARWLCQPQAECDMSSLCAVRLKAGIHM